MTSIMNHIEQASLQPSSSISELTSPFNLLNLDYDEEKGDVPMFTVSKLRSMPLITNRLQHVAVGGGRITCVTVNNLLYIFKWKDSDRVKEIDINKALGYSCKVNNVFMDPVGGHHVLLSVTGTQNANSSPAASSSNCNLLYLSTSSHVLKLKQVDKMRNHNVTAVAWNRLTITPQYVAPILLGTSRGLIFEMRWNFDSDKLFPSSVDSYCKEVFDIGKSRSAASITGIEFFRFSNEPDKYFIIATTVNRLYQFVGSVNNNDERSFLSQIFEDYLKIPESFIEIPHSSASAESQVLFLKTTDDTGYTSIIPKSFAWLIHDIGVIYRQVQLEWRKGLTEVCIQNRVLDYSPMKPAASTFVLTEFHVLLLYPDKVVGFSVLNKETVFIEYCDESYGKYIDMCRDLDGNVWLLSERAIHKGTFCQEDRFVWKIYLDIKKFALAKDYCRANANNLRQVMIKEAEYYFDNQQYEESASLYSQIDGISFEETALKFLQAWQIEALKLYLMKMLAKLKIQERAHITMISFWLIEIFEKQLSDAKYVHGSADEHRKLQRDFETLLSMPHVNNCVRTYKEVAYKILNSHGDTENLIKLALVLKDYERVVWQYLEEGKVDAALNVLKDESVSLVQKSLISSFMPKFISLAPRDTVDVLTKLGRNLEPLAVLPSLIFPYDNESQAAEVIRYLEYCILSLHSHDEAIHNYLITLYAKYKPDKVLQYLATQGHDPLEVDYEIRFALKICQEYRLNEACVQLFALLGLWESAVDLALSFDVELAKQTVPQPSHHNSELCKKLWLKIAQHVVNECNDIKQAMKLVQECDMIKIEDVLPLFNDFTTIDHFKDAICSALEDYNRDIESLKDEMDDATKSADEIRSDIQLFRNRYSMIQSSDRCCSCNIQLLIRPFYVFPCSHYFHTDCLVTELKPYLSEYNINRIGTLQHQLLEITPNTNNEDLVSVSSNSFNLKEQLKNELDSIIAAECFFCGSLTIEQINRPFIEDDEFERIRLDWE